MGSTIVQRFGELPVGARFCFRARRYEKVAPDIGRDEERGGNVFHAGTEVLVEMKMAECRVQNVQLHSSPNRRPITMQNAKVRMQNAKLAAQLRYVSLNLPNF